MKAGKFIDGVPYSWEEIYNLTGCCREDFLYDTSGECYNLLIEAIKGKKGEEVGESQRCSSCTRDVQMKFICIRCGYETANPYPQDGMKMNWCTILRVDTSTRTCNTI